MSKLIKGGSLKTSPFDLGLYLFTFLSPIFFLGQWDLNMAQGTFFVFGVFALLGLSFLSKRQRIVKNKYLGLIILWSLASVFIHTYKFSLTQGITKSFINYCLLSEGFIFVLCGCLLYYLVLSYKKDFDIAYPVLAICILNLIFAVTQGMGIKWIWVNNPSISGMLGNCSQLAVFSAIAMPILGRKWTPLIIIPAITLFLARSHTAVMAFFLVMIFYAIYHKNYPQLFVLLIAGITFVFFNYQIMYLRFLVRLDTWAVALKEIIQHPFLGYGFDNTLSRNMVFVKSAGGWVFRHNDYLNIAQNLGIPFLLMIVLAVKDIFKNPKINYLFISLSILLISCFFQTNFYFPRIASIGIILLALKSEEIYEQNIRHV